MTTSDQQFEDIWSKALSEYGKESGRDIHKLPRIDNVEALVDTLSETNRSFDDWRAQSTALHKIIRGTAQSITLISNAASGPTSTAFPPAATIFGAITFLVDATSKTSKALDALSGLFSHLNSFLVRLKVYNDATLPDEMQQLLIKILGALLKAIGRATQLCQQAVKFLARLKLYGKAIWAQSDEFSSILQELNDLVDAEVKLVSAETYVTSCTQLVMLGDVADKLDRQTDTIDGLRTQTARVSLNQNALSTQIGSGFDELKTLVAHQHVADNATARQVERQQLQEILKPRFESESRLSEIARRRDPDTGEWLFSHPAFEAWASGCDDPLLYASGIPGSGKSYLCGHAISHLRRNGSADSNSTERTTVVYHFFREDDAASRSISQALRNVAFQLASNDPVYARHLFEAGLTHDALQSADNAWQRLLVNFFRTTDVASSFIVVLDGCDEADREDMRVWSELIRDVGQYRAVRNSFKLRILMFGRPEIAGILDQGTERNVPVVELVSSLIHHDIVVHVQRTINRSRLSKLRPDLKRKVRDVLSEKADGMFVWVDLMVEQLSRLGSPRDVERSLETAPKGLNKTITHVLHNISRWTQDDADYFPAEQFNTILAWIAVSLQPLSLAEIDAVLKVQAGGDDNGVWDLEDGLKSKYASLIKLDRRTRADTSSLEQHDQRQEDGSSIEQDAADANFDAGRSHWSTTYMLFTHASIGQYFRDNDHPQVSAGDTCPLIGVNTPRAHVEVLEMYLDAIARADTVHADTAQQSWQLVQSLAVSHWQSQFFALTGAITELGSSDRSSIVSKLIRLFRDEGALKVWAGTGLDQTIVSLDSARSIACWIDEDAILTLSDPDRDWARAVVRCSEELLRPVMIIQGRIWLVFDESAGSKSTSEEARACFLRIYDLLTSGVVKDNVDRSVEDFRAAARSLELEEDEFWHLRLSELLAQYLHLQEAEAEVNAALAIDPQCWRANFALTRIRLKELKFIEALQYAERCVSAIESLPLQEQMVTISDANAMMLGHALALSGMLHSYLGNNEVAESYIERAVAIGEDPASLVPIYIHILASLDKMDKIWTFLTISNDIAKTSSSIQMSSILLQLSEEGQDDLLDIVFHTAIQVSRVADVTHGFEQAIQVCLNSGNKLGAMSLEASMASFHVANGKPEQAALLYQKLLDPIFERPMATLKGKELQGRVAEQYGVLAITTALRCGQTSSAAVQSVQALVKMSFQSFPGQTSNGVRNRAKGYLAYWYRITGRNNEGRSILRPYIIQSIDILSDEDLSNDHLGFTDLGYGLGTIGDDGNALAAAMATRIRMTQPHPSDPSKHYEVWVCDACHYRTSKLSFTQTSQPMNVCKVCLKNICDPCLKHIKETADEHHPVCDASHDWLHIPPVSDEHRRAVQPHQLMVGNKIVNIKDWVADLREQWTSNDV